MPVRNGGDYLASAVDSILGQVGVELELLLIDDGSSDGAIEALPQDPRIRVIKSSNRGLVAALNTGLAAAAHPLIARMDADDIAAPDRLRVQRQYLCDHPEISICGCRVRMFNDEGVGGGYQHYESWINSLVHPEDIEREFFVESPIPHPSAVFHRDQIIQLGGYQDGDWPEDYELWSRALLAGLKFGKPTNENLLRWRDYPHRTSRNDARYRKQAFINCKAKTLSSRLNQNQISSVIIWGAGATGAALHDALEEHDVRVAGFIDVNPKLCGQKKRGKPVTMFAADPDTGINKQELDRLQPDQVLQDNQHLLVAVAARGAKEKIREALTQCGWQEGKQFTLAA